MSLQSYSCKGCTNVCFRLINGEVAEYCRAVLEGTHKTEWRGDILYCLNKTNDPSCTDNQVRIYETEVTK